MAKFSKDDKVCVVKGRLEGKSGIVTDPAWQVSQSDWPRVEFITEDGSLYFYADEEDMELAEDPYEYAMQVTNFGEVQLIASYEWTILDVAQERQKRYTEIWEHNGHAKNITAKVVKRRKAGKVEDV